MYHEMPDHQWHAKAHNDDNPIPPTCRPRGKAGVAIIWKNSLNKHIEILQEGGNRLTAIYLQTTPPVVVINTYLPCDDGKIDDYNALLDEVREVTMKYQDAANIIWIGDMNGSLERARGTGRAYKRDKALLAFCQETTFTPTIPIHDLPTFYHHNKSTSKIDHIMHLVWQDNNIITKAEIYPREPGNTSTHDPVVATTRISLGPLAPKQNTPTPETTIKKTNWRTIDKDAYTEFTEAGLCRILKDSATATDPEAMIGELTNCLWEAGQAAQTTMPSKSRPKKTRKGLWHPDLRLCVTESKKAHWRWKKEGCPTKDSPHWQAKRDASRRLRRQQRKLQAIQREKE